MGEGWGYGVPLPHHRQCSTFFYPPFWEGYFYAIGLVTAERSGAVLSAERSGAARSGAERDFNPHGWVIKSSSLITFGVCVHGIVSVMAVDYCADVDLPFRHNALQCHAHNTLQMVANEVILGGESVRGEGYGLPSRHR